MHRRSRLSVPAPSECLHSGVPGCRISVRERSVLVIPVSERPHPGVPTGDVVALKILRPMTIPSGPMTS